MRIVEAIRGLTRPLITMLLVLGYIWGFHEGRIEPHDYSIVVGVVAAFWFGSRATETAVSNTIQQLTKNGDGELR